MTSDRYCRRFTTRLGLAAVALHAACAWSATVTAPAAPAGAITSAPASDVQPDPVRARAALTAPAGATARRIALPVPDASEIAPMVAHNQRAGRPDADKAQPLAVGFGRSLPAQVRIVALRDLSWSQVAGGGRVARVEIASPGAAALRIALDLPSGASGIAVKLAGSAKDAPAFGAFSARDIAEAARRDGAFWSPTLSGEKATIEITAAPGASLDGVTLRIPRISHLVVDGADLLAPLGPLARASSGIGTAGSCNVDVACIAASDPGAADLSKSVAKLIFVGDDGRSYLCSGTLINDSIQSNTPYLLGADHCLNSASIARTLDTYWFFAAVSCNSKSVPAYTHTPGGSKLLGRSQDNDWAIVKLNDTPPAGTRLAAWRAEPLAVGTQVISLHHPSGDLVKYSRGAVTGNFPVEDVFVNGFFTEVVWSQGITEAGSSGGPFATLGASGAYEVRGGLYGGQSACTFPKAPDYYSHLETALPLMREYLTPDAGNPNGVVVAVEFYNPTLNHYFLSTNPVEIDNLDSGRTVGWDRTGLRFLVYGHQAPGTGPVCRFYRAPAFGDSHFYSASPAECAATAAAHPVDWIYESPSVFYVQLPDPTSGVCPVGTVDVYRFFNNQTTNHRYTTERFIRNEMDASAVWTPEGYGPGPYYPIMCAAAQ
jgi:hypothetical protein